MGQQQILLIVLSVILVGIAVAVGINMFRQQADQSEQDSLASELNNAATAAYGNYLKPVSLGGSGRDWSDVATNSNDWFPTFESAETGTTPDVDGTDGSGLSILATTQTTEKIATCTVNDDGVVTITWTN